MGGGVIGVGDDDGVAVVVVVVVVIIINVVNVHGGSSCEKMARLFSTTRHLHYDVGFGRVGGIGF